MWKTHGKTHQQQIYELIFWWIQHVRDDENPYMNTIHVNLGIATSLVQFSCIFNIFLGCGPLTVTVTTRIIPFLVGNPYKPSFPTVTVRGPRPTYFNQYLPEKPARASFSRNLDSDRIPSGNSTSRDNSHLPNPPWLGSYHRFPGGGVFLNNSDFPVFLWGKSSVEVPGSPQTSPFKLH